MKSKNIGQKCVRTVSSHVFAGTFAKLNNNMILNENFLHSKNLVRLILAKFRLSFNDSQKQRFFNCNMNQLQDRLSHPTRVRGLKRQCETNLRYHPCRTPHGCADDNADMEMYNGDSKFRITRITAFQSVCPICSA